MIQSQAMGGGLSGVAAQGVAGGVSDALVAAGTTQATALLLKLNTNHFFATVGSGAGTVLPSNMNPGDSMVIFNGGANALLLYPPLGGTINILSANTSYSIATILSAVVVCVNPLKFIAMLGATQ